MAFCKLRSGSNYVEKMKSNVPVQLKNCKRTSGDATRLLPKISSDTVVTLPRQGIRLFSGHLQGTSRCDSQHLLAKYLTWMCKLCKYTNLFVFSCTFLLSRESDHSAIRARLGVASHLSTTPRWESLLSAFFNGTTSKLDGLFSTLAL